MEMRDEEIGNKKYLNKYLKFVQSNRCDGRHVGSVTIAVVDAVVEAEKFYCFTAATVDLTTAVVDLQKV